MTEPLTPEFLALQRAVAGRYSLVRELGRGGMGVVFLARDVALDRPVAIKLLPPALAADPAFRERFLREAQMAASLAHPHIVPIHAVEAAGEVVYFVMGFVDGESLGERIRRRGSLSVAEVTRLVQEVAYALSHAHARGIVHRDIKPDNILIDRESDRAMVTDFGIARADATTPAGAIPAGTPHYLSPEVARGDAGDARSDLYALGSMAYFALTGRHAFEAVSVPALLVRQATEAATPLRAVLPGAPARLAAAVDRCLAREPADRWATAEALAVEIDRARARGGEVAPALRAFVREVAPLGNDIALGLTGAGMSIALLTLLSRLQGEGLAAGIDRMVIAVEMVAVAAVFAGLALVRFGSAGMAVRDLVEEGYDHEAARAALARAEAERMDDDTALPMRDRWRRAALYGVTGILKAGAALWVSTLDESGFIALPASVLAVLLATFSIRRVFEVLRRGPSRWSRWLQGGLGRLFFVGARLVARPRERGAIAEGMPTVAALGTEADQLFLALPAAARDQLRELPRVLAALRDEATRLRERDDPAAAERLATVVAAMESFRLDLLGLAAGQASIPDVTVHLEEARRIAERIDGMLGDRAGELTPA
jgi:serine/threonine-protein kinase